jgi:hypothetical protein
MRKQTSNIPAVKKKEELIREHMEAGTGRIPKKGGYYEPAPGKFEPDSWRVQEEANEAKISTRIVTAEQDGRHSIVIVEATAQDGRVVQGVVNHDFNTIMGKKIMEMVKKEMAGKHIFWGEKGMRRKIKPFKEGEPPFFVAENGEMIPNLTDQGTAKIMDDMLRFRDFSLRDATTKAMRIAQQKALNEDWRDEEEIKSEEDEVKTVNKGKEVKKVTQTEVDTARGGVKEDASTETEGDEETEAQDEEIQEEEKKTEDTNTEGKKIPETELLDSTDELTKTELHEMTPEEIGKWAVKQLREQEKDITGAEVGKILMKYNRKRWLSTRKFNQVKNWFIDEWMAG